MTTQVGGVWRAFGELGRVASSRHVACVAGVYAQLCGAPCGEAHGCLEQSMSRRKAQLFGMCAPAPTMPML